MTPGTDGSLVATLAKCGTCCIRFVEVSDLCPSREHDRDRDGDETGSTSRG